MGANGRIEVTLSLRVESLGCHSLEAQSPATPLHTQQCNKVWQLLRLILGQ